MTQTTKNSVIFNKKYQYKEILFCIILIALAIRHELSQGFVFSYPQVNSKTPNQENLKFDAFLLKPPTQSCHSSSMAVLPDKSLFVVWYGGEREGSSDVKIYGTRIGAEQTKTIDNVGNKSIKIKEILDTTTVSRNTKRYIRKLGNPVVYCQNGRLWLFVVSVSYGGWSGSSINYSFSDDYGETWSSFKRMRATPLFNISALIRCPIVGVQQNRFLLPAYCELFTKYGLGYYFDSFGRVIDRVKLPINGNNQALQPCLVPINSYRSLAFFRTPNQKIGLSETTDGGKTWKEFKDLPLDNPDSSVAATMAANKILLVGNPKEGGRSRLKVWINQDFDFSQWREIAELENEPNMEFSYPFLWKFEDIIYLTYTWKRKGIKIVNLSKYLLDNQNLELSNIQGEE